MRFQVPRICCIFACHAARPEAQIRQRLPSHNYSQVNQMRRPRAAKPFAFLPRTKDRGDVRPVQLLLDSTAAISPEREGTSPASKELDIHESLTCPGNEPGQILVLISDQSSFRRTFWA